MKVWQRVEPTIVSKIGYKAVVTKLFKLPDGRIAHFQTLSPEGTHYIATIALTTDKRVIVARQFRPGPQKVMDELPGGGVEDGDADFEATARRELQEETGYTAGAMQFLGDVYKDAYQNATWHFFLAIDCTPDPAGQQLEAKEFVEVRFIGIDKLIANARAGLMTDSEAVFLAYDKLKNIKEKLKL